MMVYGWTSTMLDVEQAFLYGVLDHKIYMHIPEGMDVGKNKAVKLHKSIYGLCQTLRRWCLTFSKFLKSSGFKISRADNCLFIRQIKKASVYLFFMLMSIARLAIARLSTMPSNKLKINSMSQQQER